MVEVATEVAVTAAAGMAVEVKGVVVKAAVEMGVGLVEVGLAVAVKGWTRRRRVGGGGLGGGGEGGGGE